MKKIYFLCFSLLTASQIFSQSLFTYGTETVSKEEFLRAYNKNKTSNVDKEKSYREYLDLYSKFKLKVKAAKELKLDTIQQLQTDVDGFRSQVEEGYMNDEKVINDLVNEAFNRIQKEIHAVHLYVPINASMSVADSIEARHLIDEAYDAINKGRTDYANLAGELTAQHKMVVTFADLGFITAFSTPYEYENIIYGLKNGAVSSPYKTKKAWHVFKNIGERENMGRWKAAQILLLFPPDATPEAKNVVKQKADSIYNALVAGADFADMVQQFSQDRITYQTEGELPEFGTGKYALEFENVIFGLKKDRELSRPISTAYGYHIVKRLRHTPFRADKDDEVFMFDLKQKVQQDARINVAKAQFLKDVFAKINYKKNNAVNDKDIFRLADSVIKNKSITKTAFNQTPIFSFANTTVKGEQWLKYVKDYVQSNTLSKDDSAKILFDKYVSTSALDYYRKNLEKYNPDFKYQMQEFKDGNMLFEIMERNVWSKAANDSVGLRKYYNANKSKYLWGESADVIVYNCSDSNAAKYAIKELNTTNKPWRQISDESNATVQADSGRYELAQLAVKVKASEGLITQPVMNGADGTGSFLQVLKLYPANQQRSFEEAKGLVINEYQNSLEEKWVEELKKKYPIKVNEAVFQSLLK